MIDFAQWFAIWWTGSILQLLIVAAMACIFGTLIGCAIAGGNGLGRDLDEEEIEDPMPEPLSPVTAAHADMHRDVRKVRALS